VKRLLAATLVLVLAVAGCSSSGGGRFIDQTGTVLDTPPINQEPTSEPPPTSQEPPRNLTPAARSAASKGEGDRNTGVLMECVSESCRINCSARLEKRVRPKWCASFKEPVDKTR
jgi:hypothetical protein